MNVKAGEKLNKGLHKLKHGVLGKSMEGIIDAPADPAFDMIDICANNEEDEEDDIVDETLTSKVWHDFLLPYGFLCLCEDRHYNYRFRK